MNEVEHDIIIIIIIIIIITITIIIIIIIKQTHIITSYQSRTEMIIMLPEGRISKKILLCIGIR